MLLSLLYPAECGDQSNDIRFVSDVMALDGKISGEIVKMSLSLTDGAIIAMGLISDSNGPGGNERRMHDAEVVEMLQMLFMEIPWFPLPSDLAEQISLGLERIFVGDAILTRSNNV